MFRREFLVIKASSDAGTGSKGSNTTNNANIAALGYQIYGLRVNSILTGQELQITPGAT